MREKLEQRKARTKVRRRYRRIGRFESSHSPVTLFVAPEAGLSPFFSCHALLARMLADAELGAMMLSCDGLLPICSVKFAMGLGATDAHDLENAACIRCKEQAKSVGVSHDLCDISIADVLDAGQRNEIESLILANSEALWESKYDGIDFGALSCGEALRSVRKSTVSEFTPGDHVLLKALLKTSLSIYFAVRSLSSRFNIRQIVYYGDYAYHIPVLLFASRLGISVTHISHGYIGDIDQRYLSLRPGVAVAHALKLIENWPSYRERPLAPLEVERLLEGALFRLQSQGGVSTYSPNWNFRGGDMRAELGLDLGKKTIVAFPSSADEIVCTRVFMNAMGVDFGNSDGPFDDHDDWLEKLIEWVSGRPDFQLVVRLHPRMSAGSRFKSAALETSRLKEMLVNLPANVFIERPESKISSYNLAEVADVAVTAWSSMALELSRLGIPVVCAFPRTGLAPVGSFVSSGRTKDAFFQAIDRSAGAGSSLAAITEAFRWTYVQHWSHLVDISDITPSYMDVPPYRRPRNAETILEVMAGGKDLVEINMARHEGLSGTAQSERQAVVRSVEAMVGLFGAGRMLERGQGLRILSETGELIYRSPQQEAGELSLLLSEAGFVTAVGENISTRRYSKIVNRLALTLGSLKDAEVMADSKDEPNATVPFRRDFGLASSNI